MRPWEALHKAKPVIARPKAVAIHGFMLWRKWPYSSMDCRVAKAPRSDAGMDRHFAALLAMTHLCRPSLAAEHTHIVCGHRAVIVVNWPTATYALDGAAQNVPREIATGFVAFIGLAA